jgi:hypothetical protein
VEPGTFGTKNRFASNPDLPVRSFTLEFDGGRPDAPLVLNQDLYADKTDRTIDVRLVAHNGKEVSFEQELASPGWDPRASFSIRRNGRRAALVARLRATRVGPGMTRFALKLPRTLSRGKVHPFVLAEGQRMRPLTRRRMASMPFPSEVRSATVVSRGPKSGRRLRRTAVLRLNMTDTRDHTTAINKRVRIRGRIPERRKLGRLEASGGVIRRHCVQPPPKPPVSAGEVRGLGVAIRTEHHEILDAVVQTVAIRVMQRHGQRRIEPIGDAATLAPVLLQAFGEQAALEVRPVHSSPRDEVISQRRAVRTRLDRPTSSGVHEGLAGETEPLLTFSNRTSCVVEALNGIPVVPAVTPRVNAVPKPELVV